MEVALRAKLFIRTTRTLQLTEAGQELLAFSHRILDLSREADDRIQGLQNDRGGKIRISMPVSFGEFFGPEFIRQAQAVLPAVEFELDLSNAQIDFQREKLDFAIRAAEEHHPDLITRYLGHLKDVICASPAYLNSLKPIRHPKQLETLTCLLHSLEDDWNHWTLRSSGEEIKIRVHGKVSTNQYSAALALCKAGLGIARLPFYLVHGEIARGELTQILPEFAITTHPLYLVYLKQEYSPKKNLLTRDILLKWFQAQRGIYCAKT